MQISATDIIARQEAMQSNRTRFESTWQQIHDVLYASADPITTTQSPGAKAHGDIYDNSGEMAHEVLAAALNGLLTNPATKWFSLKAVEKDLNKVEHVALWLDQATAIMLEFFASPLSKFGSQQISKYEELTAYGTGGQFIAEVPGIGPLFQTRPIVELFIAENEKGTIDTVFRRFKLSARKAVQRWGERAGDKVIKAHENVKKRDDEFEYIHATFPRPERDPGKVDNLNMPFASIYVNVADKFVVEESGYQEFPWIIPRWRVRASEVYGRGRGNVALADVKMLQRSMKITIRGTEKMVDPSLQVPDDGIMSPLRMTASGINYVRREFMQFQGGAIRPILTGGRPDLGEDLMVGIRERIRFAFYNQLIREEREPRMTFGEFINRQRDRMTVLGPALSRLEVEDLSPMIDRVFAILLRAGVFPQIPDELIGPQKIGVQYSSPAAKAQQLAEAQGISQTLELNAPLIAHDPDILDNIDTDKVFKHSADIFGVPKDLLRTVDQVKQIRDAKNQAAEEQIDLQQGVAAAQAGAKVIPAIQELTQGTPVEGTA